MIPKVIHYCWFGRKEIPSSAKECINSWEKHLPGYKFRLWNEDTFDINSVQYVKEAYNSHKYAFVTDYVRLYALYHFGGIYMDTDVEVIRNFDDLLELPGFSGFESDRHIPTGIIASNPHNKWVFEQLSCYKDRHFLISDGKEDKTSNVQIISENMAAKGFLLNNTYQVYQDCMHFFPKDFFCPKSRSGLIHLTSNTYCIHHFAASWLPFHLKIKRLFFHKLIGPVVTDYLIHVKQKMKSLSIKF